MVALERQAALHELMELHGEGDALGEGKALAELQDDEQRLVAMKTLEVEPEDEGLEVENKASAELEDVADEKDLVPMKTLSGQAELEDQCLPVESKVSAELEDVSNEKGLVPMKTLSDEPELEDLEAECLRAESKESAGPDIADVVGLSPELRDDGRTPAANDKVDTTELVEDLANVLNCEWTPGMWEQLLTLKDIWRQKWRVSTGEAANCVVQARMRSRWV